MWLARQRTYEYRIQNSAYLNQVINLKEAMTEWHKCIKDPVQWHEECFLSQTGKHSNVLREPKTCNIQPSSKAFSYHFCVAEEFFGRRKTDWCTWGKNKNKAMVFWTLWKVLVFRDYERVSFCCKGFQLHQILCSK